MSLATALMQTTERKLLDLCEFIGSRTATRLIYVTHHEEEIPSCVNHVLRLQRGRIVDLIGP